VKLNTQIENEDKDRLLELLRPRLERYGVAALLPEARRAENTLPPVQCESDVHSLTLNRQVLEAAVVPAVPIPTSHSTIRADTDRLRSSGNNPVLFILKGDTQNFDLWTG
jgi:hypothetical protein